MLPSSSWSSLGIVDDLQAQRDPVARLKRNENDSTAEHVARRLVQVLEHWGAVVLLGAVNGVDCLLGHGSRASVDEDLPVVLPSFFWIAEEVELELWRDDVEAELVRLEDRLQLEEVRHDGVQGLRLLVYAIEQNDAAVELPLVDGLGRACPTLAHERHLCSQSNGGKRCVRCQLGRAGQLALRLRLLISLATVAVLVELLVDGVEVQKLDRCGHVLELGALSQLCR